MGELQDDNAQAITELLAFSGEEVSFSGEVITVHKSNADLDRILVNGGEAEAGGWELTLRLSDFLALPVEAREKGAEVVSGSETMEILKAETSIAHAVVTCGHFAGQ